MEKFNLFLNTLANWLEVIGFLIAGFTALKVFFLNREVKKINAKHLFAVRVSEHLSDYKKTSKQIALLLGTYRQNAKEIRLEVSKCLGNSLSLKKKVDNSDLTALQPHIELSKRIISKKHDSVTTLTIIDKIFGVKPLVEKDIDEYYESLTLLITETEHLDKDNKKSIK